MEREQKYIEYLRQLTGNGLGFDKKKYFGKPVVLCEYKYFNEFHKDVKCFYSNEKKRDELKNKLKQELNTDKVPLGIFFFDYRTAFVSFLPIKKGKFPNMVLQALQKVIHNQAFFYVSGDGINIQNKLSTCGCNGKKKSDTHDKCGSRYRHVVTFENNKNKNNKSSSEIENYDLWEYKDNTVRHPEYTLWDVNKMPCRCSTERVSSYSQDEAVMDSLFYTEWYQQMQKPKMKKAFVKGFSLTFAFEGVSTGALLGFNPSFVDSFVNECEVSPQLGIPIAVLFTAVCIVNSLLVGCECALISKKKSTPMHPKNINNLTNGDDSEEPKQELSEK